MRCAAWTLAGWLFMAMRAHGQGVPLELTWRAPAECPSASEVRSELERVARVRPGFSLTPLTAHAEIAHHGSGYAMALTTGHDGQTGERHLEAPDCKTLVRTLTLVLALAFGPGIEIAEDGPVQAVQPPNVPTTAPAEPTSVAPAKRRSSAPQTSPRPSTAAKERDQKPDLGARERADEGSLTLRALLGASVQLGLMPLAAFSGSVGAEAAMGAWSLALRGTVWPGVSDPIRSGLEARFDGLGGGLQGCREVPLAAWTFSLCAGARAAALRGRSLGASSDRSATAPWYAISGATSLAWPRAGVLRVRIEAALAASLDRPRFVINGLSQVHRVPLLVPDCGLHVLLTP